MYTMLHVVLDTCPAAVRAVAENLQQARPQCPFKMTLYAKQDDCRAPAWAVVGYLDMVQPQLLLYTTL